MKDFYVIINKWTGKYIAVDDQSGGYPYEVDLGWRAKIWTSFPDAIDYIRMFRKFDEWTLHEVDGLSHSTPLEINHYDN